MGVPEKILKKNFFAPKPNPPDEIPPEEITSLANTESPHETPQPFRVVTANRRTRKHPESVLEGTWHTILADEVDDPLLFRGLEDFEEAHQKGE